MKKQYTTPTIVRVELNHEQAILGACSGNALADPKTGEAVGCRGTPAIQRCKSDGTTGDTAAIS